MRAAIRHVSAVYCLLVLAAVERISPPHLPASPVVSVAAGQGHSCALTADGVAYCWGENDYGQLGDGTQVSSAVPVRVAKQARFKTIAVGDGFTCALAAEGETYCWGVALVVNAVVGAPPLVALSAGGRHACGLTAEGAAWCWGSNEQGQLGNGANSVRSVKPVAVSEKLAFTALSAGSRHTCGVTRDHRAYCWGSNADRQLGTGVEHPKYGEREIKPKAVSGNIAFAAIGAGRDHTCALTVEGAAYCWGWNGNGQLGDGSTKDNAKPVAVGGRRVFSSLTAGSSFNCGLTADSTAYCWGNNFDGQLGPDSATVVPSPMALGGPRLARLSAGAAQTCGVTAGGDLYCWGFRGYGRLGDGTIAERHAPTPVVGSVRFMSLALGSEHTCGLATDSTAYCWGFGSDGQIGGGYAYGSLRPIRASTTQKFASLSAGQVHTCGLATDGTAYCWGGDSVGQLGVATKDARDCASQPCAAKPMEVRGGKHYTALSAGAAHTCGVTDRGEVYCWGDNSSAQLAESADSLAQSDKPRNVYGGGGLLASLIPPRVTFRTVASGGQQSCALTREDRLYCWGFGRTAPKGLAAQFPQQFTAVSAGGDRTCGLVVSGRVFCWGAEGTQWVGSRIPFTSISVGPWHACGLTREGAAYCWGEKNGDGRLGTGDTLSHPIPAAVAGGLVFKSVSAGWWHTCGLATDGAAYCWGAGYRGQLGDRAIVDSPSPVRVTIPQ